MSRFWASDRLGHVQVSMSCFRRERTGTPQNSPEQMTLEIVARPVSTKTEAEKAHHHSRLKREVESNQDGLMSYGTCHTLPPAVRLSSWIPWHPSLCCTETEDSSDLKSENLYQQQPVFLFSHVFLLVIRCTAHCHLQCVSANLANSASHTSLNRLFFAGS